MLKRATITQIAALATMIAKSRHFKTPRSAANNATITASSTSANPVAGFTSSIGIAITVPATSGHRIAISATSGDSAVHITSGTGGVRIPHRVPVTRKDDSTIEIAATAIATASLAPMRRKSSTIDGKYIATRSN